MAKWTNRRANRTNFKMVEAPNALDRLRDGNHRFVSGRRSRDAQPTESRRAEVSDEQKPFAIILGCSDSRVPAEIIFDQGLGDLFVIRVAGNIVAPSQIGSVEFAAAQFDARLVVVLGHSQCGAVAATLEELQQPMEFQSHNIRSIIDRIRPSVEPLLNSGLEKDSDALLARAIRANVDFAVSHLRHGSVILERLVEEEGLMVVGAEYSLETGEVEFFDAM